MPQPSKPTVKPMTPPGGTKAKHREFFDERGDEDWTDKDLEKLARKGPPAKPAKS